MRHLTYATILLLFSSWLCIVDADVQVNFKTTLPTYLFTEEDNDENNNNGNDNNSSTKPSSSTPLLATTKTSSSLLHKSLHKDATLQLDLSGTLYCDLVGSKIESSNSPSLPTPVFGTNFPQSASYSIGLDYDFSRRWYGLMRLRHILDFQLTKNKRLVRQNSNVFTSKTTLLPKRLQIQSEHPLLGSSTLDQAAHATLYWQGKYQPINQFCRLHWSASGLVSFIARLSIHRRLFWQGKIVTDCWQDNLSLKSSSDYGSKKNKSNISRRIPHVYDLYLREISSNPYSSWIPDLTVDTLGRFSCHNEHWVRKRQYGLHQHQQFDSTNVYGVRWFLKRQLSWPLQLSMSNTLSDDSTKIGVELCIPSKIKATIMYNKLDYDTFVRFETTWEQPKEDFCAVIEQDFYALEL